MDRTVGVMGLGIMGSAMAGNLVKAGFRVLGCDIDSERTDAFAANGGEAAPWPRAVADEAGIVITSLPSVAAFHDVISGADGLGSGGGEGPIVIETSTLPIAEKEAGREALGAAGGILLDCPLSGTGAQAVTRDLVVFASGDREAFEKSVPVFEGFARAHHHLGAFGNGSKMKFVANHLVNIHNVAAAEAMVLGMKAGLDPQLIYDVIKDGAGNSRIFELRGPMMVANDYDRATMKMDVWQKDIGVIAEFASRLDCPTPLISTSTDFYRSAMSQGMGKMDTAAVCRILEQFADHKR